MPQNSAALRKPTGKGRRKAAVNKALNFDRWWKVALLVALVTLGLPLAHALFGEVVALLGGAVLLGFLLGALDGAMMDPARVASVIGFMAVADGLKHVERRGQTVGPHGAVRQENVAEHCWSAALLAVLLHGEVAEPPGLGHVLELIAAHDLVEIEAGDTFAYDEQHLLTQAAREAAAADIVFGALPPDLGARLRGLWEEFEAGITPEARYAMACDRAQGFLQGVIATGHWRAAGVTESASLGRMMPAAAVDPAFAALIEELYARARAGGMFAP